MTKSKYVNSENIQKWIWENRFRFPSWGAWLIGQEPNVPEPEAYKTAHYRILIFRLSSYNDVASSMSHGLIGQLSLQIPDVYVDYGFMPPLREAEAMVQAGIPPLFGTTSKRAFSEFDLIAFSNGVAQELVNLPWLLSHSGISLDFRMRLKDETMPIMIMGGANSQSAFVSCASDVNAKSSWVDMLYFGEAEVGWLDILTFLKNQKQNAIDKESILTEAAKRFPYLHMAATSQVVKRKNARLQELTDVQSLVKGPIWYTEETLGTGSVSVDAGCHYLCAFCKEAWERRPYRLRSSEKIVDDISNAKIFQGLDNVNLFSFNLTNHPEIIAIIRQAQLKIAQVSMKSQRFDRLVKNPELLSIQQAAGKTNFTFGLEGISERIRRFLSKSIHEHHVLEALEMVMAGPLRQIKIFFILTGRESKEDWTECQKLFEKIADLRKRNHTGGKASILLSATPLIPMPHTPMQFSAFPDETMVKNGIKNLKEIAHKHHLLFRESISLDEARMAQLLLFADGKHAEILTKNIALGTYQHDMPERLIHGLMKQLESHWMEWVWREKKLEDKFPWDMLYTSDEKSKLYSIYNHLKSDPTLKTLQFKKPPEKKPCPIVKHHAKTNVIFSHWFLLKIEPQLAGIPIRFFQVALARALMMSEPRLADIYLRPGPTINDLRTIPTSGIRIASLQFQPMPGELLQKAVSKLIPQWGWKLMKTKESIYNSTASGVLMEMNGSDVWMEKSYQEIIQRFDQSSIRYHRNKTHSSQTIQIDKSSTKKIGFDLISWDFGKQCLQWLITDDVRASGFIKKSSITRKWENGGDTFQIITWLGKETANKSQNRSMGWVNSFDGSPFQLNANENS